MTAPEVDFVLNATRDNLPNGQTLADLELERIDKANADNKDGTWTHQHAENPQGTNFVMAALVDRPDEPIGTNFDYVGDATVSVDVIGLHVSEHGAIDPQNDTSVAHNTTTWENLKDSIRTAVSEESVRTFPNVGRANTSYVDMHLVPGSWVDNSEAYSDWYQLTFDLALHGFESLDNPLEPIVPQTKAKLFDANNKAADTALFANNVTSSSPPSNFILTASVSNATRLKLTEWDGSTEEVYNLNHNATLDADDINEFEFVAEEGAEYNVELGSATDVKLLMITEESLEG